MPARRRQSRMKADPKVEVGVKIPLTAAEVKKLRALAAADFRTSSGFAATLLLRRRGNP